MLRFLEYAFNIQILWKQDWNGEAKRIVKMLLSSRAHKGWPALLTGNPAMAMLRDGYLCPRCNTLAPPVYPSLVLCRGCALYTNGARYTLALRSRMTPEVIEVLTQFLIPTPDYQEANKLFVLRHVLVARVSPFRQLTFYFGGEAGNISLHEDALDRILSYLNPNILCV